MFVQGRALLPQMLREPWVAVGSPDQPGDYTKETYIQNTQILNPFAFDRAHLPLVFAFYEICKIKLAFTNICRNQML